MANELTRFEFQGKGVRTVTINGEPWFVAKDVCEILELENSRKAVSTLDEDEKITVTNGDGNPRAGNPLTFNVVSESGLYALIFKSRKPEAKEFRKWVTKEVLPQIRKTGRYEARPQAPALPSSPPPLPLSEEIMARSLKANYEMALLFGLEGNQALLAADKAVRKLHNMSPAVHLQIELKSPDNEALIIATEIGKRLDPPMLPKFVNLTLKHMGFLERVEYKANKFDWRLTEKGKEYGTYLDVGKEHSDGTPVQQIKWKESVVPLLSSYLDELSLP